MSQAEIQLELLRQLDRTAALSQRALARQLGVSLGSVNLCLQTMAEKGWISVQDLKEGGGASRYAYRVTPEGAAGKARLAAELLSRKVCEYKALREKIIALKQELAVNDTSETGDPGP